MHAAVTKEAMTGAPWHQRLLFKRLVPKNFSKVNDMKRMAKVFQQWVKPTRNGIFEYLEDRSMKDEHYFRVSELFECWGFDNIGTRMASMFPPSIAGTCEGFEGWRGVEREWNAIETKCIGLGDSHCEMKVVPGEIDGLKASLTKDIVVLERIHDRLIEHLIGFLLKGNPLMVRPQLGSDVFFNAVLHTMVHPVLASDRSRMTMRMGGTKVGKEVGHRLMDIGLLEEEVVEHILRLFEDCKVGKIRVGETIRIRENCESIWTKFMTKKLEEPCCFFTTGFFNGLFSVIKNQHVKEIRCIGIDDPYCEWEIR
jgi:predicted hydrocarbon binding protein